MSRPHPIRSPDPVEGLRLLFRATLPVIALAVLVGVGTYRWADGQPTVFRAEAVVLLARGTEAMAPVAAMVTPPPIDPAAYRAAAGSDAVLDAALRIMGHHEPAASAIGALRSRLHLETEVGRRDSSLLRIVANAATPEEAAVLANAVAEALVDWDRGRAAAMLERQRATLEGQIHGLDQQIRILQTVGGVRDGSGLEAGGQLDGLARLHAEQVQRLAVLSALGGSAQGMASVLQPADTTAVQIGPRPLAGAAFAAVLVFAAAYGLLLFRNSIDARLRGVAYIAAVARRPVLAELPRATGAGDRYLREAANYLRVNLHFGAHEADQRVIMVTSPNAGEGKTFVATALAESFARYGHRTLLLDADLRAPSLVRRLEVVGGLSGVATTERWLANPSIEHRLLSVQIGTNSALDVLPQLQSIAGASEVLGRRLRLALPSLSDYDIIVIDTPSLLDVSDALVVAPHCSGVLLVVDPRRTTRRQLATAMSALQHIGIVDIAVVANRVGVSAGGAWSYGTPRIRRASRRPSWQPSRSAQ